MAMFEDLIRTVLQSTRKAPGPCPPAATLAVFADGQGTVEERLTVEEHLSACDHCLDQVELAERLSHDRPRPDDPPDVVITFLSRTVEILRDLGKIRVLCPSELAIVRSGRTVRPTAARFSRVFADTEIQVEVERTREGSGDITVTVYRDGAPANRIRCTLVAKGKDLISELTDYGRVRFEGVTFDQYRIRITDRANTVGEISLVLKEE